MAILLLMGAYLLARYGANLEIASSVKGGTVAGAVVVIDAGHGGDDPGKIGINDALEKDLNLQIAEKVRTLLEAEGVTVVMTRETDEGLYQDGDTNKKIQDMKNRCAVIDKADPVLTVSIHQNSYTQESVSGPQVFYYGQSVEGKKLATVMQDSLIETLKPESERVAKSNESYYLLKNTESPIVIVECGFLSNTEEAELLTTDDYQESVAWAIHMGILRYLNQQVSG